MKGGTIYFGMVAVLMLLVVGTAIYISGGFQILSDDSGLIGVAGYIVVFILVAVGFMISVGRQGCSILIKWWHKRLILDGGNKAPRIFYLLLSFSSCKSCPFISFCMKN